MTKETALNRLLSDYPMGRQFEPFFRRVIDEFVGESKTLDKGCYEQIKTYLNNFS